MNNFENVLGGVSKTHPSYTLKDSSEEISLCIDWFTCTFDFVQLNYRLAPFDTWQYEEYRKGMEKLERLYQLLTYPDSSERTFEDISLSGYRHGYVILGEHIKIFFGGAVNGNKLYHNKLEMSGQGCKDFVERGGNWFELFSWLLNNGANFTRVDCAIDVFTERFFDMSKLYHYVKNYYYVSPLRKWSYEHGGDTSTETFSGETIYIGSNYSNTLVCIYDKKLERFSQGIEVFAPAWYRVEIRFKQDRAKWFINNFLAESSGNQDFSFIAKALFAVLDFKEPLINGKATDDSNKSRWDSASWWLDFLSVSSKADFSNEKKIQTIDKKLDWLDRCVSRSLLQVYATDTGNFLKLLFEMIDKKFEDFDHVDLSIINDKRRKEGMDELTEDDIEKIKEDVDNLLFALKGGVSDEF